MTRFSEPDHAAQRLLDEAEEAVRRLNRRLARLGGPHRYSVLAHTAPRRNRKGERDGQDTRPAPPA